MGIDDDMHDYDTVASDEDTDSELTTQNNNNTQRSNRAKVICTLQSPMCAQMLVLVQAAAQRCTCIQVSCS